MNKELKAAEVETFVNNAVYLAKMKGTMSEFERNCGLSIGYFSRRTANGVSQQRSLSLQTALLVCEYLDKSIEELLDPKLRRDLEAKRMQEKLETIEQARLSLTGE